MNKQWFLINSLGVTVDLSLVSQVLWNHKNCDDNKVYTRICLGTSIAHDPETQDMTNNEWWIYDPQDRKKLRERLVGMGLPTIDLVFNANAKPVVKDDAAEIDEAVEILNGR